MTEPECLHEHIVTIQSESGGIGAPAKTRTSSHCADCGKDFSDDMDELPPLPSGCAESLHARAQRLLDESPNRRNYYGKDRLEAACDEIEFLRQGMAEALALIDELKKSAPQPTLAIAGVLDPRMGWLT